MAQEIKSFGDHVAGFLRHIKLAIATFVGISLIGVFVALSLPDMYKSSAMIMIEEPEIPEALVRTTVTVYATKQISSLNERIMTTSNLVGIIEKFDLYPNERKGTPTRLLARQVRERISIDFINSEAMTPQGASRPFVAAFVISFEDEEPEKAQRVVNELVSLYMEENLKARTEQTSETKVFIDSEVEKLDALVGDLEQKLATFKEDNADSLPSLNMLNLQMMQRVDAQLMEVERRLFTIEDNRINIEAQLATVDRTQPVRLPDGQMVMQPADQMKALQTQLTMMEGRYSPSHPDVMKVKADIAALEERFGLNIEPAKLDDKIVAARANLAVAREAYGDGHPDVLAAQNALDELEASRQRYKSVEFDDYTDPDNPAYIQLQSQLESLDVDEQALIIERNKLRAQLGDYERRIMRTPQVEREMAALSRELNSVSNRYWVLRDKQFGAEMGQELEIQSKGERFALVEPADVPLRPFAPDRLSIILLSVLVGLVFGVAVTQVADALDDSIYGAGAIISIQGAPPLIEIPVMDVSGQGRGAAIRGAMARLPSLWIIAIPLSLVVVLLVVHFVVKPLDVLFFTAMRAVGL